MSCNLDKKPWLVVRISLICAVVILLLESVTLHAACPIQFIDVTDPVMPYMPEWPGRIDVADIDGDGDLDVFICESRHDDLLRNDNGVFADITATHLPPVLVNSNDAKFGDFNGDSAPDLYVARDGKDILLFNDGSGQFSDVSNTNLLSNPDLLTRRVCIADFDNDIDLDIYITHPGNPWHSIWLNDGSGVFSIVQTPTLADTSLKHCGVGDFNGDTFVDVVLAGGDKDLLLNDGSPSFTSAAGNIPAISGGDVIVFDPDRDNDLDVLLLYGGLMENNGAGLFTDETEPWLSSGWQVIWNFDGVDAADLDCDGYVDLVMTGILSTPHVVFRNDRGNRFQNVAGLNLDLSSMSLKLFDYDGDGRIDILSIIDFTPYMYRNVTGTEVHLQDEVLFCETAVQLGQTPIADDCPGVIFIYRWTPEEGLDDPTSPNPWAFPSDTTTYTVEVTDVYGCIFGSASVTVIPGPVAVAAAPLRICEDQEAVLDGSGTRFPDSCGSHDFRWLNGATVVCPWSTSPTCAVQPAGTTVYTLEVECGAAGPCGDTTDVTVEVIPYPQAMAGDDMQICEGDSVDLDGAASLTDCPSDTEYQWSILGTVIQPWSANPVLSVTPSATTTYTLEVRCAESPECAGTDDVTVTVYPYPIAAAGRDIRYCREPSVTLDGQGSDISMCQAGLFRWRSGPTILRGWNPDPAYILQPPIEGTYELDVQCLGALDCTETDSLQVIRDCSTAVQFESFAARAVEGGIEVTWRTLRESDTLGFHVWVYTDGEQEDSPPDCAAFTTSKAPGQTYRVVFEEQRYGSLLAARFRIVELTASGLGDRTPLFRIEESSRVGRDRR
ncbi:FG-GAP-like repeat-containing protein [Acidobacteriota bacterium]